MLIMDQYFQFISANLFIAGGSDNSIKQWVIDPNCSTLLRELRFKVGYLSTPVVADFANVAGADKLITGSSAVCLIEMLPTKEANALILIP